MRLGRTALNSVESGLWVQTPKPGGRKARTPSPGPEDRAACLGPVGGGRALAGQVTGASALGQGLSAGGNARPTPRPRVGVDAVARGAAGLEPEL